MTTTDVLARVRAAFVNTGAVTPEQWDRAAEAASPGGGWEAVLGVLARTPAAWANDPEITAVTKYHQKLVAHLVRNDALDELQRRLRWNRHLIRAELGRGGMGVVFLGWDTAAGRLVALKRVRTPDRQIRARFQREARVLARLDHPGIAKFLNLERLAGGDVLVMECVAGETASKTVRRLTKAGAQLPWETAVGWAAQLLDALAHAHERKVVHRDIKPGNLMVLANGRGVKLLDVGLAKCADEPGGGDALTQDGQALGTREYMPPEQWEGRTTITAAADLYALGCTLFFLLTGRAPYLGESSYQQMTQHLSAAIPSVRKLRPDVPAAVDQVIQRMLSKNPAHRGTARELNWVLSRQAAAVRQPAAAAPVVTVPRPVEPPSESAPSFRPLSAPARGDTVASARLSATTLTGAGVGELSSELFTEVSRLVRSWVSGRTDLGAGLDPKRRVKEVGSQLAETFWGGLTGRVPAARKPAWSVVAAVAVAGVALVACLG